MSIYISKQTTADSQLQEDIDYLLLEARTNKIVDNRQTTDITTLGGRVTTLESKSNNIDALTANFEVTSYTPTSQGIVNIACTKTQTGEINLFNDNTTNVINFASSSMNAKTINIGAAGDSIYLSGSVFSVQTTNLEVKDNIITLNKGGSNGSSANAGIQIEDGGVAGANYIYLKQDLTGFMMKAKNSSEIRLNQSLETTDSPNFQSLFLNSTDTGSNAVLKFDNALQSKKIVLQDTLNNQHQFMGIGTSTNTMRFQLPSNASGTQCSFFAASSSTASTEILKIEGTGAITVPGIMRMNNSGTSTNGVLYFNNASQNKKIVFNDTFNDQHQYNGFGWNSNFLRYQVESTSAAHIFFAGSSSTTSSELFRITGGGSAIIQGSLVMNNASTTTNGVLVFSNAQQFKKIVLCDTAAANNQHQFTGIGNTNLGSMRLQVESTTANYLFQVGTNSTTTTEVFRIGGDGNITIPSTSANLNLSGASSSLTLGNSGTSSNGVLIFNNATQNKKIVLNDNFSNQHQYYGFGVNSGLLRYQVDSTSNAHTFFAGVDANNSRELLRVLGSGEIRASAPNGFFRISNTTTANKKLALYDANLNDHTFYGFGVNDATLRYQCDATTSSHVFFAGLDANNSRELFRITGTGNVSLSVSNGTFTAPVVSSTLKDLRPFTLVNSSTTLGATANRVITTGSSSITLTFPSSPSNGEIIEIRNANVGTTTISAAVSITRLNGTTSSSFSMSANESSRFVFVTSANMWYQI